MNVSFPRPPQDPGVLGLGPRREGRRVGTYPWLPTAHSGEVGGLGIGKHRGWNLAPAASWLCDLGFIP